MNRIKLVCVYLVTANDFTLNRNKSLQIYFLCGTRQAKNDFAKDVERTVDKLLCRSLIWTSSSTSKCLLTFSLIKCQKAHFVKSVRFVVTTMYFKQTSTYHNNKK